MMTSSSVLEFVIQHLDSTGGSLRDLEPCLIPQIPISSSVLEFVIQHLDSTGGSLRDLEPCLIPQIPRWVFKTYVRPIWIEAMWNFLSKEQQDKLGHYRCIHINFLFDCPRFDLYWEFRLIFQFNPLDWESLTRPTKADRKRPIKIDLGDTVLVDKVIRNCKHLRTSTTFNSVGISKDRTPSQTAFYHKPQKITTQALSTVRC
ncbi:hypothetical protein QE152_g36231 [Popillia japonica]|uniref:Maturase K n=1 Tax=Popillia japonica TaxID=7064 RepID=A0AAW1ICU2_POPJA